MRDRYKDPNDFYVYPALFFRETGKIKRNTKAKKTKKAKNKNVYSLTENSDEERKYGINPGLVSHHLPYITEFNQ